MPNFFGNLRNFFCMAPSKKDKKAAPVQHRRGDIVRIMQGLAA